MGEIIGGILGGIGSVGGALIQADAADKARKQALTGFNYITSGPGSTASNAFINAGTAGSRDAELVRRTQLELLGLSPSSGGGDVIDMVQSPDGTYRPGTGGDMMPSATGGSSDSAIRDYWNGALPSDHIIRGDNGFHTVQPIGPVTRSLPPPGTGGVMAPNLGPGGTAVAPLASGVQPGNAGNAFNQYLNSTGYQFQLDQGTDAIKSNMAGRGVLSSGATLKALTKYGQDLASTTFNNYLSQLGNVGTAGSNAAVTGQNQLGMVTNAGTGAGSTAADYIMTGGNAWTQGLNGGLGSLANVLTNLPGRSTDIARAGTAGGGVA